MQTTKNTMSDYDREFLDNLSKSLDTNLYFFGSIQRYDYYPKQSDIDIDIFSDNIESTKYKLYSFLSNNSPNNQDVTFKSFILKIKNTHIINGYKVSYKNIPHKCFLEINLFDTKYKDIVLEEHNFKTFLPLHIIVLFAILKLFHYNLSLISVNNYRYCKEFCLNYLLTGYLDEYINLGPVRKRP